MLLKLLSSIKARYLLLEGIEKNIKDYITVKDINKWFIKDKPYQKEFSLPRINF